MHKEMASQHRQKAALNQASHQQGASHQTPQFFWLMIDVSLLIPIEDFEINENWLNTGWHRVGYQPIKAQTKRIFKIY